MAYSSNERESPGERGAGARVPEKKEGGPQGAAISLVFIREELCLVNADGPVVVPAQSSAEPSPLADPRSLLHDMLRKGVSPLDTAIRQAL
jgi:hypothetical protein